MKKMSTDERDRTYIANQKKLVSDLVGAKEISSELNHWIEFFLNFSAENSAHAGPRYPSMESWIKASVEYRWRAQRRPDLLAC